MIIINMISSFPSNHLEDTRSINFNDVAIWSLHASGHHIQNYCDGNDITQYSHCLLLAPTKNLIAYTISINAQQLTQLFPTKLEWVQAEFLMEKIHEPRKIRIQ